MFQVVLDFSHNAVHHDFLAFHRHVGITPFIVGQSRYVDAVAFTGNGHGRNTVGARFKGLETVLPSPGPWAGDGMNGFGFGNHHPLAQVADHFIGHDQDRYPVGFTQVESVNGLVEKLLGR